ncbi:unnamed protein product, partial [Symbiodinium microadriaticum]
MELHEWPIVMCAAVHRAGIDFFFTVDRKDHVGVVLMEKGTVLRTFVNECFVIARITALVVSRDKLYLGLANGHLLTVDLTEVMNGNVDIAKALHKCVIGRDTVFDDKVGITCMAICSHADLFGLRNEDTENTQLVDVDSGGESVLPTNDNFAGMDGGLDGESDGRPDIAMVRTNLWASTTVAGGRAIPQRSVAEAVQFLGVEGRRVVDDWRKHFDRGVKVVSKLAPPPVPKKSRSSSSLPMESSSKSRLRSKRQLQKLATSDNITYALETGRTSVMEEHYEWEEFHEGAEESSTEAKKSQPVNPYDYTDPETRYNWFHQCYYDENGYAYNYDENGQYYYCDASFYMNLPQIPEVDGPAEKNGDEVIGIDGNSLLSGAATFDDVGYGEPYSTPGRDATPADLLPWTGSSLEDVSPETPAANWSAVSKRDALDFDNYGYYIGSRGDDYDYGNAFYTTGHSYSPPVGP